MKPLAIVGIDPGITSAYALLGLDGKCIATRSAKNFPLSQIMKEVMEASSPVAVCTDKAKVPSLIAEFSRKMGVPVIAPAEDLLKEEKVVLLRNSQGLNHHEKDSLAAAYYGYRRIGPKLERITQFLREQALPGKEEEFMLRAMKEDMPLPFIKEMLLRPTEIKIESPALKENKMAGRKVEAQEQKKEQLLQEKKKVERKLGEMEEELHLTKQANVFLSQRATHFDEKLDRLVRFKEERIELQQKELQRQEKRIGSLQGKIRALQEFIGKSNQHLLLKKIGTLGQREFRERLRTISLVKGDVLFVQAPSIYSEKVLQELKEKQVTLVSNQQFPAVIQKNFAVAFLNPAEFVQESEFFALILRGSLEHKISTPELIEKIIKEYRKERG